MPSNKSLPASSDAALSNRCSGTPTAITRNPDKTEYVQLQQRYRDIPADGFKELSPLPERPNGERGRLAKSEAYNLWGRLQTHESAVLLFAQQAELSFTNNRAERDLPMSKVKQKEALTKAYRRISSYL